MTVYGRSLQAIVKIRISKLDFCGLGCECKEKKEEVQRVDVLRNSPMKR